MRNMGYNLLLLMLSPLVVIASIYAIRTLYRRERWFSSFAGVRALRLCYGYFRHLVQRILLVIAADKDSQRLEPGNMVQVAAYTYEIEAEAAAVVLAANDVRYEIRDAGLVNANLFYSNAIGGVKILVKTEDAARALALITDVNKVNDKYCYNCESTDIIKVKHDWKDIPKFVCALGMGVPWLYKEFKCNNCGRTW
jgi:hypothetical protein